MSTNNISREQISALADNELADSHIDMALASLRQPEQQATWAVYHQIGDMLRSEDMAVTMRPDFAARMAARLEAEPTIVAPLRPPSSDTGNSPDEHELIDAKRRIKRFAVPGAVAAVAASVALMAAPQLMVAMKDNPVSNNAKPTSIASASKPVSQVSAPVIPASSAKPAMVSAVAASEGTVLRDPHIDEYLRAHQRVSPSMYNSAQFARSATRAHESEK
jgi:sigma-E factor negative regulatory protein RseA